MNPVKIFQKRPVRGLLLIISELGALGLFVVPSSLVKLILFGILALTVFYGFLNRKAPLKALSFLPGALILALCFALTGFLLFPGNMAYTSRMTRMAESLHLPYLTFARILSGAMALLGFYAFYRLALWMEEIICHILKLPLIRESPFPCSNLIFPLSALGFFAMESQWNPVIICSSVIAIALALLICLHCPGLLDFCQNKKRSYRLLSAFTALGIALFRAEQADSGLFALAAGLLSLPFLYVCLLALYSWLDSVFHAVHTFDGVLKSEKILYLCIFLAAAVFAAIVFSRTDAFYATPYEFDVIYTADSPKLVQENCYLSLRHPENDLRQPLYSVFASPFLGLPYLISRLFPGSSVMGPFLLDLPQIGLLLFTNFLLTKILDLSPQKRILFMLLTSFSYPVLLFLLMMEQYIVVYFWLILCIYLIIQYKREAELPFCAAGGTLLTSLILMPALEEHSPLKNFSFWFSRMLGLCMSFVTAMLCFGRLDIILDAPTQLLTMLQFSGKELTLLQKLRQYSGFFSQCLLAPAAAADLETMGHASWQLVIPGSFSLMGLLILGFSILCAVVRRKEAPYKAAGLWLGFSFVILFLLGWGTKENGLILYSLYFGWAVWILLFGLLQKLGEKFPHGPAAAGTVILAAEAAVNLPAIWKLLSFALFYYPI